MDALWFAPVVALVSGGTALLVAGATARRCAVVVVEARPRIGAVRTEVRALHADLEQVTTRLQGRDRGAGAGTSGR